MPFPTTVKGLEDAGYRFESRSLCRGCKAVIAFYRTPKGRRMPIEIAADGSCESHFATCPLAEEFRSRRQKPAKPEAMEELE